MVVLDKLFMRAIQAYMGYYLSNFDKKTMKLGILSGQLLLENMEVNPDFLKDIMLVQNLTVKNVTVDKLRVKFPWTNLKNEPILFEMDTVTCNVVEGFEYVPPKIRKPSSYGFIGKCFDSITVRIKHINAFVETMDGAVDCPAPRRIRQTLSGLEIMSVGPTFAPGPLAETMFKTVDGKSVIFCKRLTCEKYTFEFETEDPKSGEKYFATPLSEVPLTVHLRLKKDIADGELLCGEISMLFHHLQVKFREHEWNSIFDICKGLVASFTKKIAPPDDGSASRKKQSSKERQLEPQLSPSEGKTSSPPTIVDAVIQEETWDDCESTMVDFQQTKFLIAAPTGSLSMLEDALEADDSNDTSEEVCYARFMFENMVWTCKLAPYIFKKRKLAEKKKREKEAKGGFFSRRRAATEVVEQVPPVVLRKKLAHMQLSLDSASAVSSKENHHTLLLGPKKKKKRRTSNGLQNAEKESQGSAEREEFVSLEWFVRTDTPDEDDIEAWLRSLVVDMHVHLCQADFVFDRQAWARILRFMNIGGTATVLADATATLELRLHGEAKSVTLLVPEEGQLLDEEDQTRGVLLFNAEKVTMGSDVGHKTRSELSGGILRRIHDRTVPFPAHEEDFTVGERFSFTAKPRKFQFLIEGANGVLDQCLFMEPLTFYASLHLQKFLDSTNDIVTSENFNAHAEVPEVHLHVTEKQYLRFYTILGACWDDIRTQFIPQIGAAGPSAIDDPSTIPAFLHAFVKKVHLQLHDEQVLEVQHLAAGGLLPQQWPAPIVQAKLNHVEFTSELYNQRKSVLFRITQALVYDNVSNGEELVEKALSIEESAILGRFVFYESGKPADCVSDLRINDLVGNIREATVARIEELRNTLQRLGLEYAFDPAHNRITSDRVRRFKVDESEGALPEPLLSLVPMVLPFWRKSAQ